MRWLSLVTCVLLCGCPDSRRPPPPPRPEPAEAVEAPPPPPAPTSLEALKATYEADRATFDAAPTLANWEAAMASLDALRVAAEDALLILEDFEPVERDDLVRARPEAADAANDGPGD